MTYDPIIGSVRTAIRDSLAAHQDTGRATYDAEVCAHELGATDAQLRQALADTIRPTATDIQSSLAQHTRETAATMLNDPDLATKLADELMASEHVSFVEVKPVTAHCQLLNAIGWDTPLLNVVVTPYRVTVTTQAQREQWESLPHRYAAAVAATSGSLNTPAHGA